MATGPPNTPRPTKRGSREIFFATCAPGIEPVLHEEARRLHLARVERQVGGIYFEGTLQDAWRANLWLRTAIRVLWRVARSTAKNENELYRETRRIEWQRFIRPGATVAVTAQSRESRLDHTLFVAQRTKDAIVDQLREQTGHRPSVDRDHPDVSVHVHLNRDRLTISLDTSGESLHKRGWRRFQGRAPLAETTAAAVILMSGWDQRSPLIDPFCGSATILIEAALLAGGIAPGSFRRQFAFERLPDHDARAWKALKDASRPGRPFPSKLTLMGSDIDDGVLAGALRNIESADFAGKIQLHRQHATKLEVRQGWNAWIVTNPPYGERSGDGALLPKLFERFGAWLSERCGGYHLALLSGTPSFAGSISLSPEKITKLKNGALDVELMQLRIPS